MAAGALTQYGIVATRLRALPLATNVVVRVDTTEAPLALRLAYPGWRDVSDLEAEATWLTALALDTALTVPQPIPARSGELVVGFDHHGVTQRATLMTWLPGSALGRSLTAPNLFKMGELFAALHAHGSRWMPPPDFAPKCFDRVFSRGEPDSWRSIAEAAGASAADLTVIADVHTQVDAAYADLDPAERRVIHGDLHHDNIKLHERTLCPFDFEDTISGFPIHDIAMAMLDLWDVVAPATYDRLLDAFQRGYTMTLPWPDGDLTTFQLGRYVWRLNWTARHRPATVLDATATTAAAFRATLADGRLQPRMA